MIILLPPSEGKAPGGRGAWVPESGKFGTILGEQRQEVMTELPGASDKTLKIQGALALHARAANNALLGSPALPARERYVGVVYQGLDYASLSVEERRVANSSIHIVSGLGGLFRFNDPVPDYRAPIDARLPQLGTLAALWRPHLDDVLASLAKRHDIVDLLPNAHRAAVSPQGRWYRVDVKNRAGQGGHAAKFAKGRLARWLLSHSIDELDSWRDNEWRAIRS